MNADNMKKRIAEIMRTTCPCGLNIYACLKESTGIAMRKLLINSALREKTLAVLNAIVEHQYFDNDVQLDSADSIADERKVLYEIKQDDNYRPYAFLEEYNSKEIRSFGEKDINGLIGFAFRVNLNSKFIWLYQQVYQLRLIKHIKGVCAILSTDSTYVPLDRPVIKFDERIDVLIIGKSIITSNIGLLQRTFGFEKYIRSEAQKAIEKIDELGIVSDTTKIVDFEGKSSLTNAKKLLKAKNSPVLEMKRSELIAGLQKHPRYKDKFRFENGKIVISSQKDVGELVKMLNDSIVKSELTGREYDSVNKNILPPL